MAKRLLDGILPTLMLIACFSSSSPGNAEEMPPSLDELLKTYKELGLPLPPKESKLVRYDSGCRIPRKEGDIKIYGLAYLLEAETETADALILDGTHRVRKSRAIEAKEVEPNATEFGDLGNASFLLALAIQCHDRGWNKLALHLLDLNQKKTPKPVRKQLIGEAWYYWSGQVTEAKIDRSPVAKRLHALILLDEDLNTEDSRALLKSLDAALVPSKAAPGSIEALIDDLVNYDGYSAIKYFDNISECPEKYGSYDHLAKFGFDAVPQLIEHLNDDRLTRYPMPLRLGDTKSWTMRVGDVVADLLSDIGVPEGDWRYRQQGELRETLEVRMWWKEARKMGEEAYWLQNVLPPEDDEGENIDSPLVRLIGIKYPKRLPALYKQILEKRGNLSTQELANTVMRSALPIEVKKDLFSLASKNKNYSHRANGLRYLRLLDDKLFLRLLTASIDDLPKDISNCYYSNSEEVQVAHLAIYTEDVSVWKALEKAAKRSEVGLRMELLNLSDGNRSEQIRLLHLRLLANFLDDVTLRDKSSSKLFEGRCAAEFYDEIEVRNFAALEIASLLGIQFEKDFNRTPEEWAKLRGRVRLD